MNAPWWSTLFILSTLFTTGLPRGSAQDLNYETPYTFYPIFITNSWALFNTPACIAIDAGGNLYVTDQNSATVRFLYPDLTNWLVSTIAGSANGYGISDGTNSSARFSNPIGIARDLQGNLFVVDSSATIRKISPQVSGNLTNWVVTTIAGVAGNRGYADGIGVDAQFYSPSGIALDSAGNLYVVD